MKVVGIDLGIKKVAFAVWDDDTLVFTGARHSGRPLRQDNLQDIASWLMCGVDHWKPEHIFIEDTLIGNNRKYSMQLAETKGAILSALHGKQNVYLVNVSTWKKTVIGHGSATKQMIQDHLIRRDSAYHELCDGDQDRFDAACIGYYGVVTARKALHLEAPGHSLGGDESVST